MVFFFHLPDTGRAVYGSSLESVINYPINSTIHHLNTPLPVLLTIIEVTNNRDIGWQTILEPAVNDSVHPIIQDPLTGSVYPDIRYGRCRNDDIISFYRRIAPKGITHRQ